MLFLPARERIGRSPQMMSRFYIASDTRLFCGSANTSSATFWTMMDNAGAYLNTAVTADVYDEIVEISGQSGIMGPIVTALGQNASGDEVTLRINVDGITEEFAIFLPQNGRAGIGEHRGENAASPYNMQALTILNSPDGAPYSQWSISSGRNMSIVPAKTSLTQMNNIVRFDNYLKVEMKQSESVAVSGENSSRGVFYALD